MQTVLTEILRSAVRQCADLNSALGASKLNVSRTRNKKGTKMKKRFGLIILALVLIISGIVFVLAYRANLELKRVVTKQFNDQQLILARKIALDIRLHFSFLETALLSFGRKLAVSPSEDQEIVAIRDMFDIIKEWNVLGISLVSPYHPTVQIYIGNSWENIQELGLTKDFLACAEQFSQQDPVCLSLNMQPDTGAFAGRWLIAMSTPLSPTADNDRLGSRTQTTRLVFLLDAQGIARRYAKDVRSGKTGYPWVVDHKGFFMYHIEEDFDGRNSFIVRHERNPLISYEQINSLVANRLLKGEEGTDWYVSGWHREVIGEVEKLLAFSPVIFAEPADKLPYVWSVGLAAPEAEVYGLIQPIVFRQLKIVGLFFTLVVAAFAAFSFVSMRWSGALRREVDKKTDHLLRSEEALRHERDKVKENMKLLVQAQDRMVRSERFAAIGEAATYLSHEIKNPLMLMSGFANQVLRTIPEDDPRCEKLRIISEEAKRLEALLLEVRDFTRPPRPQKVEADVNTTVRNVLSLMQEKIQTQNIQVDLHLADDLPLCLFDPDQIKQVLLNLVKNAVEAMPQGGRLTISSQRAGNHLQVSVADTGDGIAPDRIKRIFHPFYTTKKKGTGLGLAVSYKIIQDHEGDITVQSREGEGARFTFTLPLKNRNDGQATT
jgi:signal transduction histidine kinase